MDLTSTLWRAIGHLEKHIDSAAKDEEPNMAELCKLSHALSQTASVYLKALEVGDFEKRLSALEQARDIQQDPGVERWAA